MISCINGFNSLISGIRCTQLIGLNLQIANSAHILANHGIDLQGIAFDTMLESYVLYKY